MNRLPEFRRSAPRAQRGAASLAIAALTLIIIAAALATALNMSGSAVRDAAMSEEQTEALFLAESGVERAAGRLASGTACASLVPDTAKTLGAGTFSITQASIVSGYCQVRVTGAVRGTSRTVDVQFTNASGGAISVGSVSSASTQSAPGNKSTTLTFPHTIVAGVNILLVGVTIDKATSSISGVTYNGQALSTSLQLLAGSSDKPETSVWYLLNPAVGTANVVVSVSPSDQMAAGAVSFIGVNTATPTPPFDRAPGSATGAGTTASVTVTPLTSGAWLFDVLSTNKNTNVTPSTAAPLTGRTQRWEYPVGNNITGSGTTLGPISPAALRTMTWNWSGTKDWSQVVVALRPGGSPSVVRWSEVVN